MDECRWGNRVLRSASRDLPRRPRRATRARVQYGGFRTEARGELPSRERVDRRLTSGVFTGVIAGVVRANSRCEPSRSRGPARLARVTRTATRGSCADGKTLTDPASAVQTNRTVAADA